MGKDSAAVRFSKVELKKGRASVTSFDQLPASDTVYLRLNKEFHEWRAKKLDSFLLLLKAIKKK